MVSERSSLVGQRGEEWGGGDIECVGKKNRYLEDVGFVRVGGARR